MFSLSNEGEKGVGDLHFSNTKSIILVYNPILKRFERSCEMKTIVKISMTVMKENFCLWYFFHSSFQGLPVDFGKRERWVKQVDIDAAHRETFDRIGGAVMKDFSFIGWCYKCYIKTDVV